MKFKVGDKLSPKNGYRGPHTVTVVAIGFDSYTLKFNDGISYSLTISYIDKYFTLILDPNDILKEIL